MTGLEELALVLVSWATSMTMGGWKAVSRWARDLPKPAQSVAVTVLAIALTMGAEAMGVPLPQGGIDATDPETVRPVINGVLVGLMAMGSRAAAQAIKGDGQNDSP